MLLLRLYKKTYLNKLLKMRIKKTKFKGLVILNGVRHQDQRGYLRELVIEKLIKKNSSFK